MLRQLHLLVVTVEQKESLILERIGLAGFVKLWQERVVFDPLKNRPRLKLIGEDLRQAGLADPDRPFDDDVLGLRHGTESTRRPKACLVVLYYPPMEKLREKIGQMFLVGCQGEHLTREEQLIFSQYPFGGVVLFKRNCCEPGQIHALCHSLWLSASEIAPFIAIDQEGGRVHRLPAPFTHFPAAARIGETRNPELAYRLGRATAEELALIGVNLDFAPVLDVNANTKNPIIGDRAFGADPNQVTEISWAWTRGLRNGGIIPCGKHFPGHGSTDKDSHFDLPIVTKSLDEMKTVELPPFVDACRNRIEALMTAHVLYAALDPKLAATLSQKIVTGLLRHELGYDGVVFSDDMEMKAITNDYGAGDAAALAVRAGVDVLLFCHEVERAIQAFEFLRDEAERDPSVRAQIENSYRRITDLKRRYLKNFTGVTETEIAARLVEMGHQRLIDKIHGSL